MSRRILLCGAIVRVYIEMELLVIVWTMFVLKTQTGLKCSGRPHYKNWRERMFVSNKREVFCLFTVCKRMGSTLFCRASWQISSYSNQHMHIKQIKPVHNLRSGFKPGRSRRIFKAKKILSTPSFRGEVKPSVPCRRFAACKRSLNLSGSRNLGKNYRTNFSPTVPPFATRISRVVADVQATGGESGNV